MTDAQGKRFFDYFVAIDADGGGTVDQEEFHEYFKLTMTPFSERVYGALDIQDTGELNFQRFLIGVWNLNALDHESLVIHIRYFRLGRRRRAGYSRGRRAVPHAVQHRRDSRQREGSDQGHGYGWWRYCQFW